MPIYASAETMADLARVFEFAFKGTNPFPGYLKPEPHIVSIPSNSAARRLRRSRFRMGILR